MNILISLPFRIHTEGRGSTRPGLFELECEIDHCPRVGETVIFGNEGVYAKNPLAGVVNEVIHDIKMNRVVVNLHTNTFVRKAEAVVKEAAGRGVKFLYNDC
jgi:hypothetical protein